MNFFVYILISESSGQFYIGQTQNIQNRLEKHNLGYVTSTSNKGPWTIFFQTQLSTRAEAMKLETKLKNFKSRKRILEWIDSSS